MRAGYLQFSPARSDVPSNLRFIEASLVKTGTDLIVLPELALTGYLFASREALENVAEPVPGPSTERLAGLCRREGLHIVCGMAERSRSKVYNAAVVVGPDGVVGTYRKSHLFSSEKALFDPGDSGFLVFDIAGARIGVLVCFDWIFPEAARTLALAGADVIAHPANLVLPFAQNAVVTRCLENRVFWILANRTGEETEGETHWTFTGKSRIAAPWGEVLVQSDAAATCLSAATIDPLQARNKHATPENDLFADRRTDLYRLR
jgi:predicted amidohydrolase